MNAPLNQESFTDAFKDKNKLYQTVNSMMICHSVIANNYPVTYDKMALVAGLTADGSYMLTFYKDDIRSVKTFKTLVNKWMYTS